jgi:uroporphyrinogen-III synthase
VRPLAVYETVAVPPPAEALSAWADLDAVLLHSPKGAHAFGAGTRGWPPRAIAILCLSQAVAAALAGVYPRFSVAPYPEEGALLNLLDATGP